MTNYYLYILSSRHHRHLSIGVTADLASGIASHRTLVNRQLRKRRVLQKLVYVEIIASVDDAIEREIFLKKAPRATVHSLIEAVNPGWDGISISELLSTGINRGCH